MENTQLVVRREYSKGDQRQAVLVRVVSGGEYDGGEVYRLETWINNNEDESLRDESGNLYYIQTKFFSKLVDLFEGRWKREGISEGEIVQYRGHFNPELL